MPAVLRFQVFSLMHLPPFCCVDAAPILPVLTTVYNCARIKLTAPRDGCKLWSMRFIMYPGGSHDQEQDSEYDTRIVSTREVHSRHRHHVRVGQEYGAQVSASSGTLEHAPSAAPSSLETGSLQRADQAVDQGGSLLQL